MSPEEGNKNYVVIFGMEHLFSEERPSELGLFNLEKRYHRADFIVDFHYIKGAYKRVLTKACSDRKSKMLSK